MAVSLRSYRLEVVNSVDPLNQMRQEMGEPPAVRSTAAIPRTAVPSRPPPPPRGPQFRNMLAVIILLATIVIVVVVMTRGGASSRPGGTDGSTTSASGARSVPEASPIPVDGPILPVDVSADSTAGPSEDDSGNPVTYAASNVVDGDPTTCWRTAGAAIDVSLRFNLGSPTQVTAVGLVPGYAKVDPNSGTDRFLQNRRILVVTWRADDGNVVTQDFVESPTMQTIPVAWVTTNVVMTIRQVTAPGDRDYTAVSEVGFTGHQV